MKLLTHLLQFVAIAAILLMSWIYVSSATLFNAKYIETRATDTGFYSQVTKSLPDLIAPAQTPQGILLHQIIAETVTNGYVRAKFNTFVEQLQQYYLADGKAPRIDLSDLRDQVAAAGLAVPSGSIVDQPVTLSDSATHSIAQWIKPYQWWLPIAAIASLLLIFLTSHHGRRFSHIGTTFIVAAVGEGVLYLVFKSAPGTLLGSLTGSHQLSAIAGPLKKLGEAVSAGAATQFAVLGIVLALAGFGCYLINMALSIGHHFHPGGHGGEHH